MPVYVTEINAYALFAKLSKYAIYLCDKCTVCISVNSICFFISNIQNKLSGRMRVSKKMLQFVLDEVVVSHQFLAGKFVIIEIENI